MTRRCLYCYNLLEDKRQPDATITVGNKKVVVPIELLGKITDLREEEQEKILTGDWYNRLLGREEYHDACIKKMFGTRQVPVVPYSLDEMGELAKRVVERSISVPGVQPKLSMSLDEQVNQQERLTIVGALGGSYILKPPSQEYPEMPANEHLTMLMAGIFGIRTAQSSLIRLNSGELAYIVKRMDRTSDNEKIHMLDMYQLSESYDKYKGTMERIGKVLDEYASNPLLDKVYLYELTVFSFISGNADMHLKNFSMIDSDGEWELAPAYDLLNTRIVLPKDPEELALLMDGKKSGFSRINFIRFGHNLGLNDKQVNTILSRFADNKDQALHLIDTSFLSEALKTQYRDLVEARISRINS